MQLVEYGNTLVAVAATLVVYIIVAVGVVKLTAGMTCISSTKIPRVVSEKWFVGQVI